jgi:hypothetical protein
VAAGLGGRKVGGEGELLAGAERGLRLRVRQVRGAHGAVVQAHDHLALWHGRAAAWMSVTQPKQEHLHQP